MVINPHKAEASHAMGADLYYECLGNGKYIVTLQFYRDCDGIPAPSSASITITSASCNLTFTQILPQDPLRSGIEVSPLCPADLVFSSCNGGNLPGAQIYVYSDTVTFPSQCNDWVVGWAHCCRNSAITNLSSPGSLDMYIETRIDNTNNLCNNSPIFSTLPVPFICANQLYNYNHGVYDPDGDSLHFTFVNPLDGPGINAPYNTGSGYSITSPVLTTGPFQFDPSSGQFTFTPNNNQVCVLAVRVDEYRNGVLIGSTMRDIQVVIIPCTNDIPLSQHYGNAAGGWIIDSTRMEVCPGELLDFEITGNDADSTDTLTMTTNFKSVFQGSTFSATGTNPVTGSFSWTPSIADTGIHFFSVTFTDDACPLLGSQSFTYKVKVLPGTYVISPQVTYCVEGGPKKIEVRGGTQFSWSPTTGIIDAAPDSSWILVQPNTSMDYIVTSNLSSLCKNKDTAHVAHVPGFLHTISPDTNICRFEYYDIWVNPDPSQAPYAITWTPGADLSATNQDTVRAQPLLSTLYQVTMLAPSGCEVKDTVNVNILGESPRVLASAVPPYLCPGDSSVMQLEAAPGLCGANTAGCNGPTTEYTMQLGATTLSTTAPFKAAYEDARIQYLYKASDLQSTGTIGGTITEIAFDVLYKGSTQSYQSFTVKMGCTLDDSLNMPNFNTGLTTVFNPKPFTVSGTGWNAIPLDVAYNWDGYSNLIIEICYNNSQSSNTDIVKGSTVGYNAVLFNQANTSTGCSLPPASVSNYLPNFRFKACPGNASGYSITWTPSIGLSNPSVADPVVSGLPDDQVYDVLIDNSGCSVNKSVVVRVDTTSLVAGTDTAICKDEPVQLQSLASGTPPPLSMTCQAAGTVPAQPSVTHDIEGFANFSNGTLFPMIVQDMKAQFLLRATDLQQLGIGNSTIPGFAGGTLTGVSIFFDSVNSPNVNNFTISLACTNLNDLSGQTSFITGTSQVYTTANYSPSVGWNNFLFNSTYDWDGTSNLLVQICFDNPIGGGLTGTSYVRTHTTSYKSMLRKIGGASSGCGFTTGAMAEFQKPNMQLQIAPAPPAPDFTYVWTPTTGLSDPSIKNPIATPSTSMVYTVNVLGTLGCPLQQEVDIEVDEVVASVSNDVSHCAGNSATLTAGGGDHYLWTPYVGLIQDTLHNVLAAPPSTTTYTVEVSNNIGCTDTATVTVTVYPIPNADAGADDTIFLGQTYTLNGSGTGNYYWIPFTSLNDPTLRDPEASPEQTTIYTLTVTDIHGCSKTDSVIIYVESIDDIQIPTAFTPNGDGLNDIYYLMPDGATELISFQIFNRWGELVFETSDFSKGWDGTVDGIKQDIGTFMYIVSAKKFDGTEIFRKGNITLLR